MISAAAPRWLAELGAASIAMLGAAGSVVVAVAAGGPVEPVLTDFGPIGAAVWVIWHKLGKQEDRLEEIDQKIERRTDPAD